MHIAPGAVFITRWIPPVLATLPLQLQQLYLPPSLCPRPALHCVWTGRHSGRSLKALVQDQTDSDYRQNSGKIWRMQILWSCRNPNVGIAETNSSSCRVLSPVQTDRWASGKRGGAETREVVILIWHQEDNGIVFRTNDCFAWDSLLPVGLCRIYAGLDWIFRVSCQRRSMQRTGTCECESRVKVEGPPPWKVLHVRSL